MKIFTEYIKFKYSIKILFRLIKQTIFDILIYSYIQYFIPFIKSFPFLKSCLTVE